MSKAMQEAITEYDRIAELFRKNDPTAQKQWERFMIADNGGTLAMEVINHRNDYRK